jgi:hypothetical protein
MQFLISTTGNDVLVSDLGLEISHPTTDRDLSLEFSAEQISRSAVLTHLIKTSEVSVKIQVNSHGLLSVDPFNYDPFEFFQQQLLPEKVEEIVTETELESTFASSHAKSFVFPVPISSTTSGTNLIVSNTSSFQDWRVEAGDTAYIYGNGVTNDGYTTIVSVIDQRKITVARALGTTISSGMLVVFNPAGATKVGVDTENLSNISGANLQEVIESIDFSLSNLGNAANHEDIDSLVHNLSEDYYEEFVYSGGKVTAVIAWQDSSREKKVRESIYTYTNGKISHDADIQYNALGIEIQRLARAYTYSGSRLLSIQTTETITTSEPPHEDIDSLVHNLAETSYEEYLYSGNNVYNITIWNNISKTLKIREHQYTYTGNQVTQSVDIQYNSAGTEIQRLTNNFSYSGNRVVSASAVEIA